MSKAVDTSTTSRRRLLAAAPPAVLALYSTAFAAPTTSNPDAELIGLCAAFDALERKIDALFEGVSALEFDAADAAACVIEVAVSNSRRGWAGSSSIRSTGRRVAWATPGRTATLASRRSRTDPPKREMAALLIRRTPSCAQSRSTRPASRRQPP